MTLHIFLSVGYLKSTCGILRATSAGMRLHELLVNKEDISAMIAYHIDAASLLRLAMACKDTWACVHQSETVYACVMRTLPRIRRVPKGRECKYYWSTLKRYFSKNPDFLGVIRPHSELKIFIGCSILSLDPRDTSDDEESSIDRVPMGIKVSELLSTLKDQFWTLAGRRNVIRCAYDWKKALTAEEDVITYRLDAKELLDTIAYRAEHCFIWEDLECFGLIGVQ